MTHRLQSSSAGTSAAEKVSRDHCRPRGFWITVGLATALVVVAWPSLSSARAPKRATKASIEVTTCTVTAEFPLPASLDTIPVMVTYMKSSPRKGDAHDAERELPKDRLVKGFAPHGEFNSIWGREGIKLALVGFRTCSYTLVKLTGIPNPDDRAGIDVFRKVLRHNTQKVKDGSGAIPFRGLDLYLWWGIEGHQAYAARPSYPGAYPRPLGPGPSGAVWMSKECVSPGSSRPDSCAGVLAHEVGHFLGLCHCCQIPYTRAKPCFNGLRPTPASCPTLVGLGGTPEKECAGDDMTKRLMSAMNAHSNAEWRVLDACEVETAREGARKVLQFGANGAELKR